MSDSQWKEYWASTAGSVLIVAQLALWPLLGSGDIKWLVLTGIVLLSVGVTLFSLSAFQLKRLGGLGRGESSSETATLVDTGVYAIVRHPQYIAWLMVSVAFMLTVQHWIVVTLGAASIGLFCRDLRKVDADEGVARFGDAYREYMERVPGWNPIAGVWRWVRRQAS